jgi:UDP-3-O-[3-hydroxymyristoyl] glucosamine N-acyltransferase
MHMTVLEIAERIGADLEGDGAASVTGFSGIDEAGPGDLTFCSSPKYAPLLSESAAAAVLVNRDFAGTSAAPLLRVDDPYLAFIQVLRLMDVGPLRGPAGVHPSAVVDPSAEITPGASVGPLCVVEAEAVLGEGVTLMAGTFVGRGARLGAECVIYPNVTIREAVRLGKRVIVHSGTVLGSDGFGYLTRGGCHEKVPQTGTVIIEDDVEIGANVAVDRGTLGATLIRKGVKIDNLVHIAHNVTVGEGALLVAQVGVSGSTTVGAGATLAGQAGIVGHIRIGDGAQVGAQAGVTKSVPDGSRVSGYPAMEHDRARRLNAYYRRLPSLFDQLKRLEERIAELERDREKIL